MRELQVEGGWLIRFEIGEKLPAGIETFCVAKGIPSATASGIGALRDVVLGYYDVDRKSYDRTELPGSWELLGLFADVAEWQGEPFAHTHVVLSGPDCVARGGHLFEGTVSVTVEIRLWPIDRAIRREMHEEIGLHLLDLPPAGRSRA